MGAKYLPTVKDQKAHVRFQQKANPLYNFKKPSGTVGPKAAKKK